MSSFNVFVERVAHVENHPNADRLSLISIRGYKCISAKLEDGSPRYKVGDLVIYIPEDAIVPEFLLKRGFWNAEKNQGILAGKKGNRVKAVKLRDMLSQGILFSVDPYEGFEPESHFALRFAYPELDIHEGLDVAELLGIEKYVPEIPAGMSGDVTYIGRQNVLSFDVENIKKFPDIMQGHDVVFEEKLHGTCFIAGYVPGLNAENVFGSDYFVASKGLAGQGLVLQNNDKNMTSNVYVRAFLDNELQDKLYAFSQRYAHGDPVFLLCELYGKGVQDLTYSLEEKRLACFGAFVGYPNEGRFFDPEEKYALLEDIELAGTPVLYKGKFDNEKLIEFTNGKSVIDGKTVREGVVVTPMIGFDDPIIGRAILKSVSEDYLLRKNATEFN